MVFQTLLENKHQDTDERLRLQNNKVAQKSYS